MNTLFTKKLKPGAYEGLWYLTITGYTEERREIFENLDTLLQWADKNKMAILPR